MAKAKSRRRVRDTWKEKSWYTIKTPLMFEEKEIGETPAKDADLLIGRGVEVTMRELTGDFSKQYIKLRFEIESVAGDVASTKFTGHKTTTDYVRSMIRRGTSRIDASTIVKTKDDRRIKLHVLAVTIRRAISKPFSEHFAIVPPIPRTSSSGCAAITKILFFILCSSII